MNKITLRIKLTTKNPNDKADSRIALISPVLGPRAIKPVDFLKMFDDRTQEYKTPTELIVHLKVTIDKSAKAKSFEMFVGKPSVATLVKSILNVESLVTKGKNEIYQITEQDVEYIASVKKDQFLYLNDNQIKSMIVGSLKSMKVKIK